MVRRGRTAAALACLLALGACAGGADASGPAPPGPVATETSPPPPRPDSAGPSAGPPTGLAPGAATGRAVTPVIERGPATARQIALTFDADLTVGMRARLRSGEVDSYYNEDLIATLRRLDVPATMFLTGLWMQQYPEASRDLAADPLFELGTHSHTHRAFTAGCYTLGALAEPEMLDEVTRAIEILDGLDPDATRYFRFPGGCFDRTALRRIAPAGVTAIGIDVAAGDGFASSAAAVADGVVAAARPGAIVTLHMNGGDITPLTDEAVALIVKRLRADGYAFVTVSDLLAP